MGRLGRRNGRRGLSLVEFALILPLLMLLLMGLLEYGWLFIKQHQTGRAARRGARVAILPFATNLKVEAAVAEVMTSAQMADIDYSVTYTPLNVSPNDVVTVAVSVPYASIALTGVPFVPVPTQLHASVTMAKEGP